MILLLYTVCSQTSHADAFAYTSRQVNLHSFKHFNNAGHTPSHVRVSQLHASNSDYPHWEDEDENDEEDDSIYEEFDEDGVKAARQRLEDMMAIPQDNADPTVSSSSGSTKSTANTPPSVSFGPRNPILLDDMKKRQNKKEQSTTNDETTDAQSPHLTLSSTLQHLSTISQPPLTTIMRERKVTELKLLESLDTSDDAVNELWALWFAERGPAAATLLLRAEELVSQGETKWADAETLLWGLVEEYGVHWAEPVNRLATLMYLQGRLEESKTLCELVLESKPWHFGALSGIVLVCAGMNDVSGARLWADRRLPPLLPHNTSGDRRKMWVNRARDDAKNRLDRLEKRSNIGMEEMEFRKMRNWLQHTEEECEHSQEEEKEHRLKGFDDFFDEENSWQ